MKLIMTLLARDEADVIDAQVAFHLNAGVDFVIAMDNLSQDGTGDVLESYAREGHLHLIRERGEYLRQADWITQMGRLAATDFGADWVIHSDADEFWWPRGASLKDVLGSVPKRYGIVRALLRQFVPRPDDGSFFADRMVVRLSASAPINDPRSLFRPNLKVIHRADPNVTVSIGAQRLVDSSFAPLRGWYPIEFFHFPLRGFEQAERKYSRHRDRPRARTTTVSRPCRNRGGWASSTSLWSSTMTHSREGSRTARSSSTFGCVMRCGRCAIRQTAAGVSSPCRTTAGTG
jgi:glycosyl transferase family 2